ncbi:MAG: flagellar brake domain-containing protein [Peptococcaceae bacterium]|nr:flagellar brake domain-containing protein [Peptococcaceae bacterium]
MRDEFLEGAELMDVLQPGLSMEMIVKHGENHGHYRTKIEDKDEGTLTIAVPYGESGFLPLRPGEGLDIIFVFKGESYLFPAEILSRQVKALPTFAISEPKTAKRKQRRHYVRIPCLKVVYYQVIGHDTQLGARQEAHALNISGGGFLLLTSQKLQQEDKLLVQLTFGDDFFEILCLVKRLEAVGSGCKGGCGQYRASVQFLNISERDRDKIVKSVFEIELDLRRRGLI